ncbi:MAG: putative dimethyl sulfoxide reductase chaperone [Mycobacterium sp.]|jgi:hypothetical protein|nr:putative dimethyl sulfoxide reductase chaperone [Mycobacterium sp.]MDT5343466.1 putative dimethyl sulfoxide reductase chaperone [Mycobacterium sp.]
MTRDELFASIVAAGPGRGDVVYLERRGDSYNWRMVTDAETPAAGAAPDVWMSFSAAWPLDEPARLRAFFDDLLAELESMADTADRCRWPVDDPWPDHAHHH